MQQRGATEVRLVEGGRGVFDIRIDGEVAYTKHATGRFPTDAELDALLGS